MADRSSNLDLKSPADFLATQNPRVDGVNNRPPLPAQGLPPSCLSASLDPRPYALLCIYARGRNFDLTVTMTAMMMTKMTMMTNEWSKVTKLTEFTTGI